MSFLRRQSRGYSYFNSHCITMRNSQKLIRHFHIISASAMAAGYQTKGGFQGGSSNIAEPHRQPLAWRYQWKFHVRSQ